MIVDMKFNLLSNKCFFLFYRQKMSTKRKSNVLYFKTNDALTMDQIEAWSPQAVVQLLSVFFIKPLCQLIVGDYLANQLISLTIERKQNVEILPPGALHPTLPSRVENSRRKPRYQIQLDPVIIFQTGRMYVNRYDDKNGWITCVNGPGHESLDDHAFSGDRYLFTKWLSETSHFKPFSDYNITLSRKDGIDIDCFGQCMELCIQLSFIQRHKMQDIRSKHWIESSELQVKQINLKRHKAIVELEFRMMELGARQEQIKCDSCDRMATNKWIRKHCPIQYSCTIHTRHFIQNKLRDASDAVSIE
jgi:hypothetical protein